MGANIVRHLPTATARVNYLTNADVRITSEEVQLGEQLYSLADIKSADVGVWEPKIKATGVWRYVERVHLVIVFTFLVVFLWHIFAANSLPPALETFRNWMFPYIIVSNVVTIWIIPAIVTRRNGGKTYVVQLQGAFGKANAFWTKEEEYALEIARAVRLAICERDSRAQMSHAQVLQRERDRA